MKENLHLNSTVKKVLFYSILSTIFLHFLKDTYILYYFILILIVAISFIYLIYEYFFIRQKNNYSNKILVITFILSFIYVGIISIIYQERWDHSNFDLLISFGRLFIAPVMLILLLGLVQKPRDITNSLNLYVAIFILAFLSLLLQNIVGHLYIFGIDIYDGNDLTTSRYGIVGYSSIIGSVTSYGVCFSTAVFIIYFKLHLHPYIKGLLISLIYLGAILTTSKAGFINIFLSFFLMTLFLNKNQNFKVLSSVLFFMIMAFLFVPVINSGVLGIYVNTTGHEILGVVKRNDIYIPILDRAFNRAFYTFDAGLFTSIKDYIFGIGVFGGGGVFKSSYTGTYHNSYFDIYTIGGLFFLITTIIVFSHNLYNLFNTYIKRDDQLALCFLLSNSLLFFNMLFFNGAIFHPLISFSFWISLIYLFKFKNLN